MSVYEPQEDSYLLQRYVKKYAFGRVLDMGTGSGIQALTAAGFPIVREVVAVDIHEEAIRELQRKVKEEKIRKLTAVHGDLFEEVDGSFNLIVFNPPYLPQDKGIHDLALYGGKKGWEVAERFFSQASRFLFPEGIILFLFSSHTHKKKIDEIVQRHLFDFKELTRAKMPMFEELYVYEIVKSPLLRELEKKGIEDIFYYNKGKRGMVYKGMFDTSVAIKKFIPNSKKKLAVAIKVLHKEPVAPAAVKEEVLWLQEVNRLGIGPRLLFSGENYVVMEFIEGEIIEMWMMGRTKKEIQNVFRNVLEQCFVLDQKGMTKEEMHHPQKHIIITSQQEAVLIDFERCKKTDKPQNVTQFTEYICRINALLKGRGFEYRVGDLRGKAEIYKEKRDEQSFRVLKEAVQ